MAAPLPGDKRAGFMGLIVGAVLLFAALFLIVRLTNARYASHEGAKAEATK
jgi:hypothetical protein